MLYEKAQLFDELLDEIETSPLCKKLLRQSLSEIRKMEKKASHAKNWHYTLSVITALGGATISALGSQTFNNNVVSVVHWFLFGLGLIVTFCGLLGAIFSFSKRIHHYENLAQEMRRVWSDYYFLIKPLKNEYDLDQDRDKATQQFLINLSKIQIELLQVISIDSDRKGESKHKHR